MEWIKLSEPQFEDVICSEVNEAILKKEVGYVGGYIDAFTNQLRDYLNFPHIGLFSSGTASIHLALKLLDVKSGDEVICQSLTFVASVNPVTYLGAKPIFIGSEVSGWNMSPNYLAAALEDRKKKGRQAKAIIVVHLYGMPANMEEIMRLSNEYGVPVIEDAAEALGSKTSKGFCGTLADLGVLSFNANKIITTGGGGALLAKSEELITKARFLGLQAKDPAPHYEHSELGFNYAFSNLNAVLGFTQFKKIDYKIRKRRAAYEHYKRNIEANGHITFQEGHSEDFSNRWLTAVIVPDTSISVKLQHYLRENFVETRPVWKPIHLQPLYKDCDYFGDRLEENLFYKGICLPSGSGLREEQLFKVTDLLNEFMSPLFS
ncbi:DegT/DnrJ/EryC1/StrS family aminotransferase [Echinicola sp. CAU 1574]|uniref:DegT/DnrJ/EryC1/StrS family aminotransferase n=1 Tax=Echinicola arenosa TaxID=2774144 RepID=A0ABR9AQT1_9BACT|nr:DegT/DnrJ/EryC1/StrS family aminotransferase [Echinicola arenosa]MBD8491141.1 DegT/DnrJ/EryC1/StrS family aminotransferase [Echinicola arenosa]